MRTRAPSALAHAHARRHGSVAPTGLRLPGGRADATQRCFHASDAALFARRARRHLGLRDETARVDRLRQRHSIHDRRRGADATRRPPAACRPRRDGRPLLAARCARTVPCNVCGALAATRCAQLDVLGSAHSPQLSGNPRLTAPLPRPLAAQPSTMVVMGNMVKIYAWYDNEIGYSMRTAELARMVAKKFLAA